MKYNRVWMILIAVFMVMLAPVQAQEDDLVAYVAEVMENFNAETSYSSIADIAITQSIYVAIGEDTQQVDQTMLQLIIGDLEQTDMGYASDMLLDQSVTMAIAGQPETNIVQKMSMVVADGGFYLRFDEVEPVTFAGLYPADWVNLTEEPNAFPGAELLNADQLVSAVQDPITFPLNEDTILEAVALDDAEIDGETMRVIRVVADSAAVFASDMMTQQMSALDFSALGVDANAALELMGLGSNLTYTFWIDSDDRLRRLESLIETSVDFSDIMAGEMIMTLDQSADSVVDFSDFGAEFNIIAPVSN